MPMMNACMAVFGFAAQKTGGSLCILLIESDVSCACSVQAANAAQDCEALTASKGAA